jgi:tRNA 5-methylaminomethyl-2-thiouridine biosynthesis bifunctional protein
MAYGDAQGLWHAHAAWIKPARLVQQWLDHPRIRFHGGAEVHTLHRAAGQWRLCNAADQELGRAESVVFANAHGCVDLLGRLVQRLAPESAGGLAWVDDLLGKLQAMQRMRGTLSFGPCPWPDARVTQGIPPFPVNGHGSFVPGVPGGQGRCWYAGATFRSDALAPPDLAREHAANFRKLQALLPAVAQALAPRFENQQVQAWQGSRCITHDRLPLVGPLDAAPEPTLWLCAGMGARGLSFSALCAELLVAVMGGEPLPLENNLARMLGTQRVRRSRAAPAGTSGDQDGRGAGAAR